MAGDLMFQNISLSSLDWALIIDHPWFGGKWRFLPDGIKMTPNKAEHSGGIRNVI